MFSALTYITEGLHHRLAERNAQYSVNLLLAFDGRLASHLAQVETTMEQRVDNTLQSMESRLLRVEARASWLYKLLGSLRTPTRTHALAHRQNTHLSGRANNSWCIFLFFPRPV